MRDHNDRSLEDIRKTVNDQLQGTLEKHLGDSFRLVSERLEAVQNGLGEMKNLANGVGDLKKVLTISFRFLHRTLRRNAPGADELPPCRPEGRRRAAR